MQKMGYERKGLGRHGKGIQEPIQPIMRPKYEGLEYWKKDRFDVASITSSRKSNKKFSDCIVTKKDIKKRTIGIFALVQFVG